MAVKHRGLQEETRKAPSRRTFLQHLFGTGLATVAGVALLPRLGSAGKPVAGVPPPQDQGKPVEPTPQQPPVQGDTGKPGQVGGAQGGDLAVLNFALLLEQLEAAFYNLNANKPYLTAVGGAKGTSLLAQLSGAQETPPVASNATGTATFDLSEDRTMLSYNVQVSGLSGPATLMHIHRGEVGVAGDIVYTLNTPDVNGIAVGATPINATDVEAILNQGMYLNVHTALNPGGEVRGQLVVTQAPGTGVPSSGLLKAIVDEIREHENAHVGLLTQALGASAQPAPAFQNLDAPTLQQYLQTSQLLEDIVTSAYVGALPQVQDANLKALLTGILAVEGRHAGGVRVYRKGASTAEGGDPNITLTEDREAVNRARTQAQVLAALQAYLGTPVTNPTTPVP